MRRTLNVNTTFNHVQVVTSSLSQVLRLPLGSFWNVSGMRGRKMWAGNPHPSCQWCFVLLGEICGTASQRLLRHFCNWPVPNPSPYLPPDRLRSSAHLVCQVGYIYYHWLDNEPSNSETWLYTRSHLASEAVDWQIKPNSNWSQYRKVFLRYFRLPSVSQRQIPC